MLAIAADAVIDPISVVALRSSFAAGVALGMIAALLVAEIAILAEEGALEVAARVFVEAVDVPSRELVEFPEQQGIGRPGCFVVQRRVGCAEVIEVEDRQYGRAGKCRDAFLVADTLPSGIASRVSLRIKLVHIEHPLAVARLDEPFFDIGKRRTDIDVILGPVGHSRSG